MSEIQDTGKTLIAALGDFVDAVDRIAQSQEPPHPPPPPPPPLPPLPTGPYRVIHRGSIPGGDDLTNPARWPFKSGDVVYRAQNPRGDVSWFVEKADQKGVTPIPEGFTEAFTL